VGWMVCGTGWKWRMLHSSWNWQRCERSTIRAQHHEGFTLTSNHQPPSYYCCERSTISTPSCGTRGWEGEREGERERERMQCPGMHVRQHPLTPLPVLA
jgi:hypothetical protein